MLASSAQRRAARKRGIGPAIVALGLAIALARVVFAAPSDIARATIPAPGGMENHGAAIAQMPSGALLVCWYSGLHEEDRSVRVLCSRGSGDGAAWSPPWTAVAPGDQAIGAAAPDKSLGNVTLTVTRDGRVWMVYGVIQSHRFPIIGETCTNWACGRIDARVSADEGRTWSRATRLVDVEGALPRAELRPVRGGWLGPFYEETAQRSFMAKLAFDGGRARLLALWRLHGPRLIQPALVAQNDGRFRVYFRDQQRQGVYAARFDPRTGAWSDLVRTNLPNPGSAVDAFTDGMGRYVLIYNPSATSRDKLALARSVDGAYFIAGCSLSLPGIEAPAAYPSVIRGRDGVWRAVYSANAKGTIRFVRFTSGWLDECFSR